jgi:VanZ family protein
LICAGIFAASSLPATSLPKTLLFAHQDKVEHGFVYAVLGFFVARAWHLRRQSRAPRQLVVAAALFALVFGASDEFHQWFVPGRSVDVFDLLADFTGGLLGGVLGAMWASRRRNGRHAQS